MITFSCEQCKKSYSIGDQFAGRKAKCKACGAAVVVPKPKPVSLADDDISQWLQGEDAVSTTSGAKRKSATSTKKHKPPMRVRRLTSDAKTLAVAFRNFPLIQVSDTQGNPPDRYQITFNIRGLVRGPGGEPVFRDQHVAEIQLTSNYPRQSPKCRMLTPIFHPNIEPAAICVGDHWTAGERLVDLIIRIGEMISYQAYNIKSPLDGDAAMWADKNAQHLPVDKRDMRPPNLE